MRYVLRRLSDGLYFTRPYGPDNAEWTDLPRDAHQWVDYERCLAAHKLWLDLHGVDTRVMQMVSGPHFYQVSDVGTTMLSGVSHG
jgi:hypothetical protein